MGRKLKGAVVAATMLATTLGAVGPAAAAFSDVPSGHWARTAIRYVAEDRSWMRDFGTTEFRPEALLTRKHLARATVRAFGMSESTDADLTFSDLPKNDQFYRFANVAVKLRWMEAPGGAFKPEAAVRKTDLDRALVLALGLKPEVRGLRKVQTADGVKIPVSPEFPHLVLAKALGLHYNHPTSAEGRELLPTTKVKRADGAYALYRAATAAGTYRITALSRYRKVVLGKMNQRRRKVAEFAFAYAGYPYVYAGEWHRRTPAGYCCGAQAQGGFDCSGYVWWVIRRAGGGWDNSAFRPYTGWRLDERASRYMAQATKRKLSYKESSPTDLMFFAGGGGKQWQNVNHVGMYLGKGWMIDSSSSRDGVSIVWVKTGWYRDHFVWSRRVVKKTG